MVADIDPHVIGITESWANKDIVDAELALTVAVKVHEPLGSSDHNQIHFNIKVKTGNTYKKTMEEELQQRQI